MKVAFDLDGVVFEFPEFFSALAIGLRLQGHEVIVLTDSTGYYREFLTNKLFEIKLEYDQLVITGNKEQYCLDNNIEYAFDDMAEYYPSSEKINLFIAKIKRNVQ